MSLPRPCTVAVALVHHPVYSRSGDVVTTSITNLDIHDIARIARTYGAAPFYVVTPVEAQRRMVETIVERWNDGPEHPRLEALGGIATLPSLDSAIADLEARAGVRPDVIATGASYREQVLGFGRLRSEVESGSRRAVLLVFGTGWGLTREVAGTADARLEAIDAGTGFNHLPVRAAVAVVLDRILGPGV